MTMNKKDRRLPTLTNLANSLRLTSPWNSGRSRYSHFVLFGPTEAGNLGKPLFVLLSDSVLPHLKVVGRAPLSFSELCAIATELIGRPNDKFWIVHV